VPFAGLYSGRDEILHLFEDYFAAVRIREYHFQYRLIDGDYVSWHFRLVADVPSTGKTFDAEFTHVWQFDGGRPVFCRSYYDTQLLVEAFTAGGPTWLMDRQNLNDDFEVRRTPYDIQSMVKTVYDLFFTGDIPGVFALLADDVYVYFKGKDNPQSGDYHGFSRVLQFVYNLAGTAVPYDISRFSITEGDRTDVVLFEHWMVFATGKHYYVHTVNSWRINEQGKLMGFINYPDVDEVAAAYVP
ncbi:MAG TPA: nuclear transport factor 2 family protein, partial [Nitrospirota bacterium]|nr:nuclear transport factor 2 family protein [Nitrospirota bacterium]